MASIPKAATIQTGIPKRKRLESRIWKPVTIIPEQEGGSYVTYIILALTACKEIAECRLKKPGNNEEGFGHPLYRAFHLWECFKFLWVSVR